MRLTTAPSKSETRPVVDRLKNTPQNPKMRLNRSKRAENVSSSLSNSSPSKAQSPAINLSQLRQTAKGAVSLLRVLANPDRLLLLCRLTEGEANVGELAQSVNIAQPTLSQQLGVLRQKKMVATRREGKHIYYRICEGPAMEILKTIHDLYCPK